MAKKTTDEAILLMLDSKRAKDIFAPSYINKIRHRVKTNGSIELSKKIDILTKLGAVPTKLTWKLPKLN